MTSKNLPCKSPCVKMFADSLEYVFMNPGESKKYIAAKMNAVRDQASNGDIELRVEYVDETKPSGTVMGFLERLFGKDFTRALSMFYYIVVETSVTMKGLPARFELIVVRIPHSRISDFIGLASNNGEISANNRSRCSILILRRIRDVIKCAYAYKPWMWFAIRRVSITSAGSIVISMVRPSPVTEEIELVETEKEEGEEGEESEAGGDNDMQ